jgi:quercetin dioxygenase-like cupin family protein
MSSRPHPGSERPLHGPVQSFDLEAEVGRLREEGAWHRGQRNSITLRKGEGMNVGLVVMKAGDRLEEHTAPGPFSLSVREGRIRFEAAEDVVEAGPEALLTCDTGVHHTVVALSDAAYLLTIVGGSSQSRALLASKLNVVELYRRTSGNAPSRTFVNKGKKKNWSQVD